MEVFVQSSGDHGIIVFSLGSMIGNLTMERANTIASALGQIPQKVCNFLSFYSNRTAAFWKYFFSNFVCRDFNPKNQKVQDCVLNVFNEAIKYLLLITDSSAKKHMCLGE